MVLGKFVPEQFKDVYSQAMEAAKEHKAAGYPIHIPPEQPIPRPLPRPPPSAGAEITPKGVDPWQYLLMSLLGAPGAIGMAAMGAQRHDPGTVTVTGLTPEQAMKFGQQQVTPIPTGNGNGGVLGDVEGVMKIMMIAIPLFIGLGLLGKVKKLF